MNLPSAQTSNRSPDPWRAAGVCILLVLAVLAVFGQTAHFEFVGYDDQLYVFENPMVEKGLSWKAIGWAFTHAQVSNWIPLTTLSHMLDCQLFGLNAGGHHLVNVLLHALNAVLVFLVLRQMTGSLWRSAFVAALFAVHPLRAESVAWVSERKDVLSGCFFLLTIGAYVHYARKPSRAGYGLILLLFALGLLAKSMVATLPFVLLLLDYWPLGRLQNLRQLPSLMVEKLPLFLFSAAACVATALMPGLLVTYRAPFLARVSNAVVSYVIYLKQMVYPEGLVAHYPITAQPFWTVAAAFFLLATITTGLVVLRKRHPGLLVGWLWYLGMLVPVIGIIQISQDAAHADRYTYLPEIGLAIAGIWGVGDWISGWKTGQLALAGLMGAVICVLTVLGRDQVSFWRNDESLWTRTLACTSDAKGDNFNSVAYTGLGNALSRKGQKEKAIVLYEKALEINPGYKVAHYNLGIALFDKGETGGAIAEYRTALKIDPDYVDVLNNLGIALGKRGELPEAILEYTKALKLEPAHVEANYNLGNALLQQGKGEEAIAQYRKTLEIKPDDARVCNNLGIALEMKGENEEAIALFRKALAIKPEFVDAYYDLAAALLKSGKVDEAVVQFRKTLELNPDLAKARFGLGKALLRKGQVDEAMTCFEKTSALNQDPTMRWFDLGDKFLHTKDWEEAVACYEQGLKINPQSVDGYTSLGLAFYRKGEIKGAIESWQRALDTKPDQPGLQNDLAWLLATAPNAVLRDGAKAVGLAEQANQLTGDGNATVLHTLAAAYAEAGRYADATTTARRALEIATAQNMGDLEAKLPKEIQLYAANKPMRDSPQ